MKTQIEIKDGVFTVKGNNTELLQSILTLTDEQGGAQITDYDGPKMESEGSLAACTPKDVRASLGSITMDGKAVPYREVIEACSGSYLIHGYPGIEEVLESATNAEFTGVDVIDFLCPIVDEILVDAKEVDEAAYLELVGVIKKTYETLKTMHEQEEREEAENTRYIIVPNSGRDSMLEELRQVAELSSSGWDVVQVYADGEGNTYFDLTRSNADGTSDVPIEVA
ncbi:hypothetical protein [Paenibacillus terrigena]|uniref:hypothetical protein n=1 Tax=Paenibacillus terrigena TaxID=369333 RepID=UPI0028D0BF5F|nr:hypothetical protein [Paenibacillus terrigena]